MATLTPLEIVIMPEEFGCFQAFADAQNDLQVTVDVFLRNAKLFTGKRWIELFYGRIFVSGLLHRVTKIADHPNSC